MTVKIRPEIRPVAAQAEALAQSLAERQNAVTVSLPATPTSGDQDLWVVECRDDDGNARHSYVVRMDDEQAEQLESDLRLLGENTWCRGHDVATADQVRAKHGWWDHWQAGMTEAEVRAAISSRARLGDAQTTQIDESEADA